jgi:membrane dipeptidase
MKKLFPGLLFALISACSSPALRVADMTGEQLAKHARGIHERLITLDTHVDFRLKNFTQERNYSMPLDSQVDLPGMRAGGLDVAWLVVFTAQGELNAEGYAKAHAHALEMFAAIHRLCAQYAPDQVGLALNSDDVRRIHAAGKSVAMIAIENAYPVGLDLGNIKRFHDLGGRYMSLAHNGHSQFSDSHTGEAKGEWLHDGLSELGRQAVAEMNKWGIIVDISHPSKAAILEMIQLSRAPLVASHSAARAVNDVSRNLDDEQLLLLKENGGVVQTVAFRSYINSAKDAAHRKAMRGMQASGATQEEVELEFPPVDLGDFVDHIDHMVELIGIDHVGISSDFDGGGGLRGWDRASETFNVTLELVKRGYQEEQIAKLWNGNLLRVLDDVQRIALEIQAEN